MFYIRYKSFAQHLQKQETILRLLRDVYGLTQQEVADKLCVSRQTYSAWECGRSEIPLFSFLQLAAVYDIDIEVLIDRLFHA